MSDLFQPGIIERLSGVLDGEHCHDRQPRLIHFTPDPFTGPASRSMPSSPTASPRWTHSLPCSAPTPHWQTPSRSQRACATRWPGSSEDDDVWNDVEQLLSKVEQHVDAEVDTRSQSRTA